MSTAPPGGGPVRSEPLLVTAELPPDVFAWADGLRRAHYPPERNRLQAHVTLFHALPPSARAEVRRLLAARAADTAPPSADIVGLMDLDRGTAIALASRALTDLHADLAEHLRGVIQQRDDRPFRPHITVQNKVTPTAARALQAELARHVHPRKFQFRGFGLYSWDGHLWRFDQLFPFRGRS